jgi:C-3',4' desaturase CrtD
MFDVIIVGAGIAGMATAARLQARGFSTLVFEAHGQVGGCAGFFREKAFSFDVGATTFVDFEAGGVGGELFEDIGMTPVPGELLPGYVAHLPDRTITLFRDRARWAEERLKQLGDTPQHRAFWSQLDHLADVFWSTSRDGMKLPIRTFRDLWAAAKLLHPRDWPLARFIRSTLGDALAAHRLSNDQPLVSLLSMLVEDTVHSTVDRAPLINAALGVTIRGAGLTRPNGGCRGFWRRFVEHYRALGGQLRVGCAVTGIEVDRAGFRVHTRRGDFDAKRVVSAVPASLTARLAPVPVKDALEPYLSRDANALGGAIIMFLGVPEEEVAGQTFTHHQILERYDAPLGDGNNMFISVSAPGDRESAPEGHRAVMISTHCELGAWEGLTHDEYREKKAKTGERLLELARRVYPALGRRAIVRGLGTPVTYERFTHRPRGAVGGVRQTLANSNQHALPHQLALPGLWMVGDSTWPGLGTVACVLGSRIVASEIIAER